MPALSLKIILEDGAVTRVMKFPSGATVADATKLVQEKLHTGGAGKDYGLFQASADDDLSGIWLEDSRPLDHYVLKDGDSLHYRCRVRTLRIRMLDGSVKTMHVDESKPVEDLMVTVCGRLGITNHEEYGFCREEEPMEAPAQPTGTLTLKRKPQREKDAAMQQLSKKLKTDDNVQWLEQRKTLRESSVAPTETLLLKRRLFYSDRKVDARDPVQLNLLFVQARDAVLEGRHPVTEAQAMEFAGILCQVQYGDYQEDKHKPGFIEKLTDFLPQQYSNSWGAEKKVLKEHSKHTGLSQIEAKYLYTKTVRDLPTYGVTFFLVKEIQQKGKKKLVPRLLGISANSVLRLDETTKEVLQVWPLTQVKTYKASKGEMFTLNFGDYSDKEYCVKTNDAYRIRDILQGYIDLIRKKMEGPYNPQASDAGVVYSATVESSKGNVMEVVSHSANKVVETSFVGPTKIVSYEQGSNVKVHGTQIMTAQEVIVTSQSHNKHTAVTGGVAMRSEMSTDTAKKLNELNGNAVKIVKLLTDPNENSIEEARKIVAEVQRNMPILVAGVKQCIEKQPDDAAKKKLTMELKELCDNVELMNNFQNPSEAQEAAMRIADLTTQMYFALDPGQKKRIDFIRRSRQSFIEDDRTQATLQRASFINAMAVASQAIDDAKAILNEKYEGERLNPSQVEALERSCRDKLAKLNAAIALFAAAHSDPKNIDYAAATNSMITIKELMPELAKDAQALSCVEDGHDRRRLLQDMRDLCDAAASICQNTGCDDLQKIYDEADNYARKAGKLIFTFGRGVHPDKENEIIDLAKAADDKARLLMATTSKLASEVDDPGAAAVRQAVAKCSHAAQGLRTCAQLTASSPHEPHCRSALSAASEDLSSSAQLLANACRPLLDHPEGQGHAEAVKHTSAELAKALERLNIVFGDIDDNGTPSAAERERWRLQFVNTLSETQDALNKCDEILKDHTQRPHNPNLINALLYRLAEVNAAVAALVAAFIDPENPDYAAATAAMAIVQNHMPDVVKGTSLDCRSYTYNDEDSYSQVHDMRESSREDAKALCEAMRSLALNFHHGEDAHDSVKKFAEASSKLTYRFDMYASFEQENQIIDLAKSSCEKTSDLLAQVYSIAADVGGGAGEELDARGTRVADAAQALLTTAQLTAPSIQAVPCKRALVQTVKNLSSDLDRLAKVWQAACHPQFAAAGQQLDDQRKLTEEEIQKLMVALNELSDWKPAEDRHIESIKKRVRFTFSLSQAQDVAKKAEKEIDKPVSSTPLTPAQTKEAQRSLADKLASLNAAIAIVMAATQDPYKLNYEGAETATATIQQLIPELVEETKALSSGKNDADQRALIEDLRAICASVQTISASGRNALEVNDALVRYENAARRLTFVCSPNQAQDQYQYVLEKTSALCERCNELSAIAFQLGEAGADEVEQRGRGVAHATHALRTTAQLTVPALQAPACRAALHQAASDLARAVADLDGACRPTMGRTAASVRGLRLAFDDAVTDLMLAIEELEDDTPATLSPEQEKRRVKFVETRSAAQAALADAVKELEKPVTCAPLTPPQASALQSSLSDRLATLNAAIAALLAATRDSEKPDYAAAESATATIQELMPDLVKDAKILNIGKKDKAAHNSLLESLRALCDATNTLIGAALPQDGVQNGKEQDLTEVVTKFTGASGKLVYAFNPRADSAKEDQIIELTKSTCQKTSELLAQVNELTEELDDEEAEDLDTRGAKVADAAQNLLTTAEITASSITSPLCQSSLLTSLDALSSSAEQLALAWPPVTSQARRQQLELAKKRLDEEIAKLKEAVKSAPASEDKMQSKKERLRFQTSLASTEAALKNAEKEINEPCRVSLPATAVAPLQDSLANRLAALNAAINSLVAATRDHNNPDYATAETATTTIRELMPDIVKDAKTLGSSKDPASRDELLAQIRALCEATRRLGASAEKSSPEELNEAATQFSLASGKLNFVFNPRAEQKTTHEIIESCKVACIKTSEMLQHVHALAALAPEGAALDARGAVVSDAARALLTTAQLTAHTAHSLPCQAALLSAADNLSTTIQDLQTTWAPVVKDPRFKSGGEQLGSDKQAVDEAVERIKGLVTNGKGKKGPAVPVRTGSLKRRAAAGNKSSSSLATEEFLDAMRSEASHDADVARKSPTSPARSEEEKQAKLQFNKSVEDARQSICTAEENLVKYLKVDSKPPASLTDAQMCALNKQMEHKLARANAAAACLLASRGGGEKTDYKLASKCVGAVADLMPTIVTDAKTLGDLKEDKARKVFLDDTLGLCTASKNLCDTAKNDKKKLTEAALSFGNQSSKLLYAVSTDIDPSQENEVLVRAKAVGDVACRATERLADTDAMQAQRCASQATVFMYTAKLVAPSIQDPECQNSLITASKDLSSQLRTINSNKPELAAELATLEQLIEAIRSDVASGQFVKRRETMVVEDTPLRKLTAQVVEDAKQNAEDSSRPADERRAMADFANKLTDALKMLDLANARCKNKPHDMKRRADLEDAVLNVQQLVLQGHPRRGNSAHGNIVDLADYLKAVSSGAEHLLDTTNSPTMCSGGASRAAGAAGAQCRELRACVTRATAPVRGTQPTDADHAAKECISRVQKINTAIECCPEGPEKNVLKKEARPLNESCALLKFANQSALATARCAALDEALDELAGLEHRIDRMLEPKEGERHVHAQSPSPSLLESRARLATAAAGVTRDAKELAPAFVRYVADMRAHIDVANGKRRMRLADHLKKLNDRLKLLTMETGRQVVTWRDDQSEAAAITDEILKELDNAEEVIGAKPNSTKSVIAHEDLKKLLIPVDTYRVEGDKKQLEAKLESSATKLNSMTETIMLSVGKPESLARSAHVTAESAVQLAAIAKAMKNDEDPTKHSKIDEASQELCFVTYNLLKTAESASHDPNSNKSRRRLLDACRSLTDAINKLTRTASSADKLHRECNELSRSLQLRQSSLQPRPSCTLPYAECVSALQTQHAAIENLKSDQPMSRDEFCTSLDLIASAVTNNVEYAEQCAYLLSISEQHPELAKEGMFDAARAQKLIAAAQDCCFRVTRSGITHQAKEESFLLSKQLSDLKQAIQESSSKVTDPGVRKQLTEASGGVETAGMKLQALLNMEGVSVESLTPQAFTVLEALSSLQAVTEHPTLAPLANPSAQAKQSSDEVLQQAKELLTRTTALMRAVKTAETQESMTWVMFNTYTKGVVESSDHLVTCVRNNGQNAGLIEGVIEIEEDADMTTKSYVQTQVLIANKWLHKPTFKPQIKTDGESAARNVIEIGKKMTKHLKDAELEEMQHLTEECEQLLTQCSAKYDVETGSVLMDRLKELAKAVDRCVVTMVVEDLIEEEEPLADLETFIDAEKDETKRKFILEKKIAELLAHLGRVTRTARVVAAGQRGDGAHELTKCSDQASLLAPKLVKAAEKRVIHPTETAVVEDYRTQLAQYSESLSRVRDLCDRAVDPMQFVQTAEEAMQRMKEESTSHQNDMQKCSNTSTAIRKLANRVINVSMSSKNAQRDPELMKALSAAQQRLKDAEPAEHMRASKLPDWRMNIAEILRATGEVESVLGGEMIFRKQPEPDRPIYNAARNLHAAVREWSARDNEIVAVAKRMAVLMAKLSDHMHSDRKREVISTSKAIVAASHEVAQLARKLALECTDMRIRTNLLQVCDQIPLISGQLKMLTTVKGSSLGRQGTEEDIEAMNMLVGNAQNLMTSIQDVVNAAAGASVKIRSQRGGPRMRWVRKNYQ